MNVDQTHKLICVHLRLVVLTCQYISMQDILAGFTSTENEVLTNTIAQSSARQIKIKK